MATNSTRPLEVENFSRAESQRTKAVLLVRPPLGRRRAGSPVQTMPRWKRAMDIIVAAPCVALLAPLFLAVAIMIKVVSPGSAFFRQKRVGLGGKTFTLLKFRTMNDGNNTDHHMQYLVDLIKSCDPGGDRLPMTKQEDETRIFPLGGLLRRSYVDELPQLLNVLRGDMSLVGPRPAIPYEVEEYQPWYNERFDVVPGMTGLWQVSGKNLLSFDEMVRLDIRYARGRSFRQDVNILLRTPLVVFSQMQGDSATQTRTEGDA